MAEDMEPIHTLRVHQLDHVLRHCFRLVASVRLITVGKATEVWRNECVAAAKSFDHRKVFATVLRPTMHTENDRTRTALDIVKVNSVAERPLMLNGKWKFRHNFLLISECRT